MTENALMKAGLFLAPGKIELRDLPVPTPGAGEVLLRVNACGVCGTDNHIFEGELTSGVVPPVVLGHEIAATVEAIGDGVVDLQPGQFCAVDPVIGCGCCPKCRAGLTNLCADPAIIGYNLNGGFAQYMLVPAGKVVPMDAGVGSAGGVLCETLACVLRGYDRLAFVAGSSAMILGAGTVGLLWAQVLKSSPAGTIIQTEIVPFRRDRAKTLGANVVIDPGEEDLAGRVDGLLGGGADYIIDATGSAEAIQQAMPLLAPGGTFMIFGVCPAGSNVCFDPHEIFLKESTIIGSKMPPGTLDRAARLIESGRIACEEIVADTLPLAKVSDAVEGFNDHRDRCIKVAIDPWA